MRHWFMLILPNNQLLMICTGHGGYAATAQSSGGNTN
jgi:hypothetical protein